MGNERYVKVFVGAAINAKAFRKEEVTGIDTKCGCSTDVEVGSFCSSCGKKNKGVLRSVDTWVELPSALEKHINTHGVDGDEECDQWWSIAYKMQNMTGPVVLHFEEGVFLGTVIYEFDRCDGDLGESHDLADLAEKACACVEFAKKWGLILVEGPRLYSAHEWM